MNNREREKTEIIKFIDYLLSLELGHFTESKEEFPSIFNEFRTPYEIIDCIIEVSDVTMSTSKTIFKALTELGCQTLELRVYDPIDLNKIKIFFIDEIVNTRLRNMELILPFSNELIISDLIDFTSKNPIIGKMVVHSCPDQLDMFNTKTTFFIEQKIENNKCCGNIGLNYFTSNLPMYLLSLNSNNCLNKKLSIDAYGNIKNCPSMTRTFGSVKRNDISSLVKNDEFQLLWKIKKDEVKTCQDCEFRYVCSDCRAYLENPDDVYSKPLKCGYSPYTNEWSDWSTNPLKKIAIKHYALENDTI